MGACDSCLDGRHNRCKRIDCTCSVCVVARPKAPKKPKPRKPRPPKDPAEVGSNKPLTKEEEDALCADLLKLVGHVRVLQVKDTAAHALRGYLNDIAASRAEAVADSLTSS